MHAPQEIAQGVKAAVERSERSPERASNGPGPLTIPIKLARPVVLEGGRCLENRDVGGSR